MNIHEQTRLEIEQILQTTLKPIELIVIDDSAAHRNHAEARLNQGAGHFKVVMKSTCFDGLMPVARHRLVYQKLASLMDNKIHALSLDLKASNE